MSSFSASDAAVSGFRFIARQPKTVAIWAGVLLAYELLWGGLTVGLASDQLASLRAFSQANGRDPEAAMAMLPSVSVILLFGLLALLALGSLLFSAAYRALLHPEDRRFGHISFGAEELRFAGLMLVWLALSVGGSFVIAFVTGLLAALGEALPSGLQVFWVLIVMVLGLCAFVYPLVRLSLSMPLTMDDHHIRLLESWRLTRGKFWPLFWAYFLAALLILLLFFTVWGIVAIIVAVIAVALHIDPSNFEGLFKADTSSLAAYFSPASVVAAALNALALAAGLAIFTAPVAEAYHALHDGTPHPEPRRRARRAES
jgi:hypothetical protein